MSRSRTVLLLSAFAMAGALIAPTAAFGSSPPSGQRALGNTTIEPAYDDANGSLVYLLTPNGTQQGNQVHPNAHNVAPIYLPVYPLGSTVGALNCMHIPADNCPDHGPIIAGLAKSLSPDVYAPGVLGHDHLVGIASTGGDFNVTWEPVALIFTKHALTDGATNVHMTTLSQVRAAEANGDVFEFAIPPATFKCASVSVAVYNHATPVPPAPPLP